MPKSDCKNIDVIILCGGKGTRLKPLVSDRPKVLAEVNGIPFVTLLINYVASFGFRRFILCIGYRGEQIRKYCKYNNDRFSHLQVVFSEEKRLLGTAGAIKNAAGLIRSSPFLVMNGDTFCRLDFKRFLDFYFKKQAKVSLALAKFRMGADTGKVRLSESGEVIQFDEKKKTMGNCRFVNTGIFLMERSILLNIPARKRFSLEHDLFPSLIEKKLYGFNSEEDFIDIGTPRSYKKAGEFLVAKR